MKLLLDFLPLVLFFATFKLTEGQPDAAAAFATEHLGFLVSGGVVGKTEAPVLLATLVVMAATLIQALITKLRGKKIDLMLWISLALVVVLGGATIWFHNATFIKWKPTLLYWAGALAFLLSELLFGKNLLKAMLKDLPLPEGVWKRLNWAWVLFFALLGVANLYVAYHYSDGAWANFKVFGVTGLIVLFTLAQGLYLSRHVIETEPAAGEGEPR
ncbi:septation protein A [Pelomonas sp. CA6]|uniref:septation protein A n=1 Tax=Pelomonas sp. CA6 TaxID=2907999 RepID=UPI001F4BD408|nr:septation protein A [Pelomonas sp. CA6]MCH7343902.1 septation protein A [Pelomonas sp. CA6]